MLKEKKYLFYTYNFYTFRRAFQCYIVTLLPLDNIFKFIFNIYCSEIYSSLNLYVFLLLPQYFCNLFWEWKIDIKVEYEYTRFWIDFCTFVLLTCLKYIFLVWKITSNTKHFVALFLKRKTHCEYTRQTSIYTHNTCSIDLFLFCMWNLFTIFLV